MGKFDEPLFHRFGCGVLLLDSEGKISFANEPARSALGLTAEYLLRRTGHPFDWQMRSIDDAPLSAEEHPFARGLRGESFLGLEVRLMRPGAGEFVLSMNGSPLRNEGGEIEGAVFDFNDITAKKEAQEIVRRAKEELEISEGRLRALIGSIDEIVFELDVQGTYLHIWTDNEDLLRRPPGELIGARVDEVLGEEVAVPILKALKQVFTSGEPETLEYCLDVLGGRRCFLARVARIPAQGDRPPTLSFLARDITERKKMEDELRASRRQFQQMLENVRLATLVLDPEGRVRYCNDHLLHLLERDRDAVEGAEWVNNFIPAEEREALESIMCEGIVNRGELPAYHENAILTRSGRRRLLAWNNILLRDGQGRFGGYASIAEDITERREAEEVLRRSSQMKSEFISTAAHELRTPLTAILGYCELLLKKKEFGGFDEGQQQEFLQEIQSKGELLSRIVNQLLDLCRLEGGQPILLDLQPCNLHEVMEREIRNYRTHYPDYRFVLEAREECPEGILVDRDHMEQALQNLLSNAVKYSSPGSTIRLGGVLEDREYIVSVSDEGIGMSREQIQKIFERFYRVDMSDKAVSGLGLGMSVVRGIIEGHGGSIWVLSAPGKGTTVCFALPVNNRPRHVP